MSTALNYFTANCHLKSAESESHSLVNALSWSEGSFTIALYWNRALLGNRRMTLVQNQQILAFK